ncbi:MAG: hypothetical protein AAFP69_03790 [Planctomycetota bacterium]
MKLPKGISRIDLERNNELNHTPFNPAADAFRPGSNQSFFSDRFNQEIGDVIERFSNYFSRFGHFGSLERSHQKLPSHWWINDDFFGDSRVLMVDVLNRELTKFNIITGAQAELSEMNHEWMLLMAHNNDYDDIGDFVKAPGEFWFWVTRDHVEFYSELDGDLDHFYSSLPTE